MAENVGNLSLRTCARSVMIDRMPRSHAAPRNVVIVVFGQVQSLDVTGPLEVFAGAHALLAAREDARRGYRITVVSRDGEPLRTSSGLAIVPDCDLARAPREIDTLIVAGG
jgi:transcriptional regulator GlxA family with amidase domain